MNSTYINHTKRWSVLTVHMVLVALLCVACSKNQESESKSDATPKADAPASPQATGLVKNPVKLSDTADAVKWMDMASTKTPAQIAKEEKTAKDAKEAKLAAEAKEAREAKLAVDAKIAADAKAIAIVAKAAQAAKEKEAAKAVAVVPPPAPVETPKAAAPVSVAPVLSIIAKEQPKYPKTAAVDGITSGLVTAQVLIETDGHVSKVDIIKATPRKYFDKAVIAAALKWKYAPITKPMTTILEFNFKLDGDGA